MKMELKGHSNEVVCCCFLSDKYLLSGSSDKTIRIWDVESGKQVWLFHCPGGVISASKLDENTFVLGDSAGNVLQLSNVKNLLEILGEVK